MTTERRLSAAEVTAAAGRMQAASTAQLDGDPTAWQRWYDREGRQPARLEFPLGELLNAGIRGYVWAWGMQRRVATAGLRKEDRLNAQGLEGKATVEVDLVTALLVAGDLPPHRCNVIVPTTTKEIA